MRLSCSILLAAAMATMAAPMATALTSTPAPVAGYGLSVFATAPAGASVPDDIEVSGNHVFVGYGNGVASDGSDGKSSLVVEYSTSGQMLNSYSVVGHVESVRVDPANGQLYTNENEDGNTKLTVINPSTGAQTVNAYPNPSQHGGGFDDLRFLNGNLYAVGSNPNTDANNNATGPAIYRVTPSGSTVSVTPVLYDNSVAVDKVTGNQVTMNLFDPDSMTVTPNGHLLLDHQSGAQLVDVANPGATGQVNTSLSIYTGSATSPTPANVDDTQFAYGSGGAMLFSDKSNNTVYALTGPYGAGAAFSADTTNNSIDLLNFNTGLLTPVVTGVNNPGGMAYLPGSAVPEPANAGLLALGVLALAAWRRRRTVSV